MSYEGDVAAVAVDSRDRVYVFNRGTHPLVVFNGDGSFHRSLFTKQDFVKPHGMTIDQDDFLYLIDEGRHCLEKCTPDGRVLLRIGVPGRPADWQGGQPFNRPTDVAVHPESGDVFVSDGYGNSRVHRFLKDGSHVLSWGVSGGRAGEFSLPHGICLFGTDRLVVCDRENWRLQLFTLEGEYLEQWHAHHPSAVAVSSGDVDLLFVGEMGPAPLQAQVPNLGHCVSVLDRGGRELVRLGGRLPGAARDQFVAPHGLAVDSSGDLYVAEVTKSWSTSFWGGAGTSTDDVTSAVCLRKWRRCAAP